MPGSGIMKMSTENQPARGDESENKKEKQLYNGNGIGIGFPHWLFNLVGPPGQYESIIDKYTM